jgi:CHAT domain
MSDFEFKVFINTKNEITVSTHNVPNKPGGGIKLNDLTLATIQIFEKWLNKGKMREREEFEVLGSYLYKSIFGDIEDFFKNYYKKAQDERKKLVVQLCFEEPNQLANLPWEYLYSPDTNFFAIRFDLVFSRYLSLEKGSKPPQLEDSPLRVLVVVSSPEDKDLAPVRGAEQIVEEIKGLVDKKGLSIQIDVLKKPTLDNFLEELDKHKPHVLHFIGYSRSNKKGEETAIALLDDDGKSVYWVVDRVLITNWFHARNIWIPPLIFLQLCGNATTINYDIVGLALQLSREADIPVVATQHPLTDTAANRFSAAFYSDLARGYSIPIAVQNGRSKTFGHGDNAYRDLGAIVLYTRNADISVIRSHKDTFSKKRSTNVNTIRM